MAASERFFNGEYSTKIFLGGDIGAQLDRGCVLKWLKKGIFLLS